MCRPCTARSLPATGPLNAYGKAHFVANLDALRVVPGVLCIGQDLATDEGVNAALSEPRYLLDVTQVRVMLVLDDVRLPVERGHEESVPRVGLDVARLVPLLMSGAALGSVQLTAL